MIVDRIEGNIAVIEQEDGSFIEIPLHRLPEGVREGSVLTQTECGFSMDAAAERARRELLSERTAKLFRPR